MRAQHPPLPPVPIVPEPHNVRSRRIADCRHAFDLSGASEIRFMMDDPVYKVHEVRELGFWEGT